MPILSPFLLFATCSLIANIMILVDSFINPTPNANTLIYSTIHWSFYLSSISLIIVFCKLFLALYLALQNNNYFFSIMLYTLEEDYYNNSCRLFRKL